MATTQSGIENNAVTVSTSVTLLALNTSRRTLLTFTNNGSVTVFLGGDDVSSTSFLWPLTAGETVQFTSDGGDVSPQMKWYGRTASSTASVSVGEVIN